MAKKYTFTVTATLCEEYEDITREYALEELRDWLEPEECGSVFPGYSPFKKIEIV